MTFCDLVRTHIISPSHVPSAVQPGLNPLVGRSMTSGERGLCGESGSAKKKMLVCIGKSSPGVPQELVEELAPQELCHTS